MVTASIWVLMAVSLVAFGFFCALLVHMIWLGEKIAHPDED
jgi:uncharacterized membrane protein